MKPIIRFSYFFLFVSLITSCKKIINVDLKDAPSELVIDAIVNNIDTAKVTITNSVYFSSPNVFPGVSGASVTITDTTTSVVYPLVENTAGNYINPALIGQPFHTYQLNVSINGNVYSASSTMPAWVKMDTLLFEDVAFGKSSWAVQPRYQDPNFYGHYYKFVEKVNGNLNPRIWVWDDRLNYGGISTRPLIQFDSTINLGDTVEVEMNCIDKNIFRYFTSLDETATNATAPANPPSNISGGVLGYFSAQTRQKRTGIVKP